MKNSIKSILNKHKKSLIQALKTKELQKNDSSKTTIKNKDKNKVWAFCSGHNSNDFRGNPKYLFIYVNKYCPDIEAYWLCSDSKIIKQIRNLGYKAYKLGSKQAEEAMNKTGVLVAEQVKQVVPEGLETAKYINLWHGVGGVKNVERSIESGRLVEELSKKYIEHNTYYRENQMYLAPSKFIEGIAIDQLGLTEKNIIRAGYPRCIYQNKYDKVSTFDGNIVAQRGLPEDTRIAAYVPTFRNEKDGDFFIQAIPNMEQLVKTCEENHILFIFKMHPFLENELGFIKAKEKYKNSKWVMFWDNQYDFYEIMGDVDLCIMDFSSMFTDFIALGTKHFIRYVFDFDKLTFNFPLDYDSTTLGHKCLSFDELIEYLPKYQEENLDKDIARIKKLYWEYSHDEDMETIVKSILEYTPIKQEKKKLYSFDIFDTLISRKVLDPIGIHYYVKEKIEYGNYGFDKYFVTNYPELRRNAELNLREYYTRTKNARKSLKVEIQFDEIFQRLQNVYGITDEQIEILKKLEVEAELENVIPLTQQIDRIKKLLQQGEKVILISDMYLPKDVITKMLKKADPILGELDLYLSSEYGYQKADSLLYVEVYKEFGKNYNFDEWIHTGDNPKSDFAMAKKMKIKPNKIECIEFNEYEKDIIKHIKSYDAYLIAAQCARFRDKHRNLKAQFIYSYISFLFVPYVEWALNHAKNNKDEIVYFVSRDGHQLKRIADVVNKEEKLNLTLEYFYGSRKCWRIPSFINEIDEDFWDAGHGNLTDVKTYDAILKALYLDEKKFKEIFPELTSLNKNTKFTPKDIADLTEIFKSSKTYSEYLLKEAEKGRESICGYLGETLNKKKKFSIIEYWGRGYTQENFTRLWNHVTGKEEPSKFYYSRSTLPSEGLNIRYNYTVNPEAQQFIESIFACIDYKSISKFEKKNGKWEPVIVKQNCDYSLFRGMEEYLPEFAEKYCNENYLDKNKIGRDLINFAISYYSEKPTWEGFTEILAELVDSVHLFGQEVEYAPTLTQKDIQALRFNKVKINELTKNPTISVTRSSDKVKEQFYDLYLTEDKEHITVDKKYKRNVINKSKKLKELYDTYRDEAETFKKEYRKACKENEVKNKISVIVEYKHFNNEYKKLIDELSKQDKYEVEYIQINDKNIHTKLAESKYIIMTKTNYLFAEIKLRKETKIVLIPNTPINYFSKGLIDSSKLKNEQLLENFKKQQENSIIQSPSESTSEIYNLIYNTTADTELVNNGSCVTDIYFDENAIKQAKTRINKLFKKSNNKKIIAYITYNRYRNKDSYYLRRLNLDLMKKELGNEYVVLEYNLKNDEVDYIENVSNCKNFSKNITNKISLRELMMAADIIVGDYNDIVLESPLTGKPTFITKWKGDNVENEYSTMFKLDEAPYGNIVRNTEELIEEIKNIKEYDYSNQKDFKEKYLTNCTGESSKNIVNYMINN